MSKSKTMWFAAILAALGVVQTQLPELKELLHDWYPLMTVGVAAAVAALRMVTRVPLSEK